jgi:hypothetical protein
MRNSVQGSLLLIYTLHVDLALQLVAGGKSVAKSHPYAGSKQSAAIDTALKEWWRDGAPAEAPVLLAWAAFQIFLASEGEVLVLFYIFLFGRKASHRQEHAEAKSLGIQNWFMDLKVRHKQMAEGMVEGWGTCGGSCVVSICSLPDFPGF